MIIEDANELVVLLFPGRYIVDIIRKLPNDIVNIK